MTLTLVPDDNPRRLDRGPQAKRHVGSYYGPSAWRRLMAAEPPVSKRDRDAQFGWLIVVMIVPAAILAAALIVTSF